MTWTPLTPRRATSFVGDAMIACGGRKHFNLLISLRLAALPEQWRAGLKVGGIKLEAAIGTEAHYGKLRLSTGGIPAFTLKRAAKSSEIVRVRVPVPEGADGDVRPRQPTALLIETGASGPAVVIDLPKWAPPKAIARGLPAHAAAPVRSVTAGIMGDPPKGRSAADQRNGGRA